MKREQTTLPNIEYTTMAFDGEEFRKPIDRIVIHTTIGSKDSAISTFSKPTASTSAHYIVDLDGTLYQGLEEYNVAFHAGNYAMNQRSIGIEHADNGHYTDPRPDSLYKTSAKLVADICKFYGIPVDRQHILKHNEVTATGCPHNLDIDRIVREANEIVSVPVTNEWQKALQGYLPTAYKPQDVIDLIEAKKKEISSKDNEINNLKQTIFTDTALISNFKTVLYGKGWTWTKISKLKDLLPK